MKFKIGDTVITNRFTGSSLAFANSMEQLIMKQGVITGIESGSYWVHGWLWPESALKLVTPDYNQPITDWTKEMLQEFEASGLSLQGFREMKKPVWYEVENLGGCGKNHSLYTGEPVYTYRFDSLYQIPDNKSPITNSRKSNQPLKKL